LADTIADRNRCVFGKLGLGVRQRTHLKPQPAGFNHRIDPSVAPPIGFAAAAVDFTMVSAAKRDGEFIADLAAKCSALRKPNMMGVRRPPIANQTWLLCNEFDVIAVTNSSRLRYPEDALVN
jgi:hypothetical protein